MGHEFTLPSLESSLDRLLPAQTIALTRKPIEHLFGMNDVAAARLQRFARGHDCIHHAQ